MPPPPVPSAFAQALQHHQAGHLREAEALYRQVLARQPDHADALHYLGLIAHQLGRHDLAVQHIHQSLALAPQNPAAHSNLGSAFVQQGRFEEAISAYRRALELKPDFAEAHYNLGVALKERGRSEEAIASFRRALQSRPDYPDACLNLGNLLLERNQTEDAVAAYRRAIEILPHNPEAHDNLGNALRIQGRFDESVAACRRALELKSNFPNALNNLGNALSELGQLDEAVAVYRRALQIIPDDVETLANLGFNLAEQGQLDEAASTYRRALQLQPEHARAKFNYSLLLLLRGEFTPGWPLYESRWAVFRSSRRNFSQPLWDGSMLQGQRVLIHAEQGLGDSIQFIRYAPLIAARGGSVVVECPRSLVEFLRHAHGVSEVVVTGEPLPPFDFHVPMLSQPLVFKTTPETIPQEIPYLFADPARQATWRQRLAGDRSRVRVGIAWSGNPKKSRFQKRDLTFDQLRPIFHVQGIDFFSLQMGRGTEQIPQQPDTPAIVDHTPHIHDFADTAALMMELDLIISVDTSVAHLAGALGRPVWTLLPSVPDWRWGLEGETTLWYPTMRLFRQPVAGDWPSVIQKVAQELNQIVLARTSDPLPSSP